MENITRIKPKRRCHEALPNRLGQLTKSLMTVLTGAVPFTEGYHTVAGHVIGIIGTQFESSVLSTTRSTSKVLAHFPKQRLHGEMFSVPYPRTRQLLYWTISSPRWCKNLGAAYSGYSTIFNFLKVRLGHGIHTYIDEKRWSQWPARFTCLMKPLQEKSPELRRTYTLRWSSLAGGW